MLINFTKMHGLGNDFVVIDAINQHIDLNSEQIKFIANRNFGIGCDQLLLVQSPLNSNADFRYRIFNADGGEVAQCGNGARCFARYVRDKGLTDKTEIRVDTDSGQLLLKVSNNNLITVDMGIPRHQPEQIPLQAKQEQAVYQLTVCDQQVSFGAVSMGNPHAVIQVDDLDNAPVTSWGPVMESHAFFPERVNVGFMQIIDREHIRLRVYERGAAETLACGSGACAAAVVGIEQGVLAKQVVVELPGGKLTINWEGRGQGVLMSGPATSVFEGQIKL